jgi:hypothetical protein
MERYLNNQDQPARTTKNHDLYETIYNDLPSSDVDTRTNESEIDISKIKELIQSREGYNRIKQYESVLKTPVLDDDNEEYDIYDDIDNKIYDINTILENARANRTTSEREKYRNLRNTQYDILSRLNLNEETPTQESDEMVTDFFTQDKSLQNMITNLHSNINESDSKAEPQNLTSADLFEDLKGNENTILTEAVTPEKESQIEIKKEEDATFYTDHLNFTKDDFEGFQNLQTTVKKNNKLVKVMISILAIILVATIGVLVFIFL